MTVPAHTNAVGVHYLSEPGRDTKRGYWGSGRYNTDANWDFTRWKAYSEKSETVRGDHKSPLPYYRYIAREVYDNPTILVKSGSDQNGSYYDERTLFASRWTPSWTIVPDPPGYLAFGDNVRAKSNTEARNKLRQGKVQNGVDIIEARKTANQISDLMRTGLYAWKSMKHGNFSLALKHLGLNRRGMGSGKTPGDAYLGFIYGIQPLVGSIYDNVQLLRKGLHAPDATFTVVRNVTEPFSYVKNGTYIDTWDCSVRVKTSITARVSDSVLQGLDSTGVLNPLEIAWELLPYSFVLDWFVPVGNYLESLSATMGLDFVSGYESIVTQRRRTSRWVGPFAEDGFRLKQAGQQEIESYAFARIPLTSWPPASLYADTTPFNTKRVAAALALLRQCLAIR